MQQEIKAVQEDSESETIDFNKEYKKDSLTVVQTV